MDESIPMERTHTPAEIMSNESIQKSTVGSGRNGWMKAKRRLYAADAILDTVLISISIVVMLALISIVTWYCLKKRRKLKAKQEKNLKAFSTEDFPEIAVVKSKISSADSASTNEDTASVVSSIWDSSK